MEPWTCLKVINVVECFSGGLLATYSFSKDPQGKKNAEDMFKILCIKNRISQEDIKLAIEDSHYACDDEALYEVYITYSL